jgi:hypothetical protein
MEVEWLTPNSGIEKYCCKGGGELSDSTSPNFELSDDSMIDMIQIMT